MVIRRLMGEWMARVLLVLLVAGMIAAIVIARRSVQAVEIHALMPEKGGWLPDNLTAEVGVPLELNLISDDVVHGFAVGQQDWPAVDVKPGQVTELALKFDQPGTYIYYCTRWCGPNHWRMRGTIEVTGEANKLPTQESIQQPPYINLGLDIDAPHEIEVKFDRTPSAARGESLDFAIPPRFLTRDVYLEQTPFDVWQALRADPMTESLNDADIWDLVAFIWRSQASAESWQQGLRLYAQNCAACHGGSGDGNGVFAQSQTAEESSDSFGSALLPPSDFTDVQKMLGASSALLQGKIVRGGMGTGMPYWGTIFSEEEIEALIDYLWTFQFPRTAGE
jgi:cytochrome c oxidase subunit 2